MHGLDEEEIGQNEVLACPLRSIARVEERRFELRDLAAEIFFHHSFGVPPLLIALSSNQVSVFVGYSYVDFKGF